MNDALITGAVERNHRARVAPAMREVILGAAQVTQSFFARRGDKLDRMLGTQAHAVDFRGEGEHDRQAATVVVDSRSDEPLTVATNGKVRVAREDSIEMRADHNGGNVRGAESAPDDIARLVGVNLVQPRVAKSTSHPACALVLFARRRGDLSDGNLRAQNRVVMRGEASPRGGE